MSAEKDVAVTRLPWRATGAAVVAFLSLAVATGHVPAMGLLSVALVLHYLVPTRIPDRGWVVWGARAVVYGSVFALHLAREDLGIDTGAPFGLYVNLVAELLAAELVLQAWRARPSGGVRGEAAVLLSSIVLLAGFNVYLSDSWPQFVAPLFFVLLAFQLRSMKPRTGRVSSAGAVIALLVVLLAGVGMTWLVSESRGVLIRLDAQFLRWLGDSGAGDLSDAPRLGRGPGSAGGLDRVLIVDGALPEPHVRAMAFERYEDGAWGDPWGKRRLRVVRKGDLREGAPGPRSRVRRLAGPRRAIPVPLDAAGVELVEGVAVAWDPFTGCGLSCWRPDGLSWEVALPPHPGDQGPLCRAPDEKEIEACLEVPAELRSRLAERAQGIGGRTPMEKVARVEAYLPENHGYGLEFNPGDDDDALCSFLLGNQAAHCEYFAAAAAILLRLQGVPARYVVGYYAHEPAGRGRTVVRSRDAHAWTEAWVEGVGWVTVDATPASGLPDATGEDASVLRRLWERVQDAWADAIAWLRDFSWKKAGVLALGAAAVFLLVRLALVLWRVLRAPRERRFAYSGSDGELGLLARRFERELARRGKACPPGRTWREHLPRDGRLLGFVTAYESARFGGAAAAGLEERLEAIERSRSDGGNA